MDANPYTPPVTALVENDKGHEVVLAARWRRLVACIIDTLLQAALWIGAGHGLQSLTGWQLSAEQPARVPTTTLEYWLEPFITAGHPLDYLLGFAAFLVLQGWLLARRQQTIGKLMLGVRITDASGQPAGLRRILLARELPWWLLALVPFGTLLVALEPLFIFRRDRRCLHDLLAGTRVVAAR